MRIKKDQPSVSLLSQRPRPSRFTVDLSQARGVFADEEKINDVRSDEVMKAFFHDKFSTKEDRIAKDGTREAGKIENRGEVTVIDNETSSHDGIDGIFSDLAFFSLFKIFFKMIYKIGYFVGTPIWKSLDFLFTTLRKISYSFSSTLIKMVFGFGGQMNKLMGADGQVFSRRKMEKIEKRPFSDSLKQVFDWSSFSWSNLLPQFRQESLRSLVPFAIALLLVILPFGAVVAYRSIDDLKGKVLGESVSGVKELFDASKSAGKLDFNGANNDFSLAGQKFFSAQQQLGEISGLLNVLSVIPNDDIKLAASGDDMLLAGQAAANLGNELTLALSGFSSGEDMGKLIAKFIEHGDRAVAYSIDLDKYISAVDVDVLPSEHREKFAALKGKSSDLKASLAEFVDIVKRLSIFLGTGQDKRYLLVFQNNSEARATGGFIGSYALIDFKDGKIKNIEAPGGGSYDTEAGLYERVVAPRALHIVNPLWHFWDANWWPDWAKSAQKLAWFYEKSDGPTVDGVISFTPDVLENILKAIGPIDMTKDYGVVVDSDNFWITAQTFSEQKQHITKTPKKFIGDLMNKMIEEMPKRLSKDVIVGLASVVEDSFRKKQALLYFTDKELEDKVREYDWGGQVKQTSSDYLQVVNSNVAGGKSDKKIKQVISHKAEIMPDGSIVDDLTITREHTGSRQDEFVGLRNVNYMRIYVPEGSELISASGFERPDEKLFEQPDPSWTTDDDLYSENTANKDNESGTSIYKDLGKTVFANWTQTEPGQTTEVRIRYRLPFKVATVAGDDDTDWKDEVWKFVDRAFGISHDDIATYSLMVQKQPGARDGDFSGKAFLSQNYDLVSNSLGTKEKNGIIWDMSVTLDSDLMWGATLKQRN